VKQPGLQDFPFGFARPKSGETIDDPRHFGREGRNGGGADVREAGVTD
jgi:hypothetical protein